LSELTDDLARARATVEEAERLPQVDRSVVQRLEEVRDEIFAVDDRQSVLGAARNKRRVAELRSEEAILLDRLGFDTYSAYVMGMPSVRADLERGAQISSAREAADRLEVESVLLRNQLADTTERDDAAHQLHRLLTEAQDLLGWPRTAPRPPELADDVVNGSGAAESVHHTSDALRTRSTAPSAATDEAAAQLRETLERVRSIATSTALQSPTGPVEVPALADPPSPEDPADAAGLLALADRWSWWIDQAQAWWRASEPAVVELERRIAQLRSGHDADRISRWAEVEAELDEALDRLAAAQERVRAHEAATEQLAALRTEELELRDRERDLLTAIAEADAAIVPPTPPPFEAPTAPAEAPGPDPMVDTEDPEAVEWALIARLARQRTLSFVGSVPIVLDGIPSQPAVADAVLRRLARMSDLIQVILVSDDERAAQWCATLADDARRIDL
jgi:hypothetical protein